jgi:DNA-binding XRE family transcriptional regulator
MEGPDSIPGPSRVAIDNVWGEDRFHSTALRHSDWAARAPSLIKCGHARPRRIEMPNIGNVLKEEIVRLSRRESRSQVDSTRKATIQHRREIAALKRHIAQLERQVALLSRKTFGQQAVVMADTNGKSARFSAKGLRVHRERLGLSADDFGKLLGVSAQSVYNWEQEKARPRAELVVKVAALRGIGKRDAKARLEHLGAASKRVRRKA